MERIFFLEPLLIFIGVCGLSLIANAHSYSTNELMVSFLYLVRFAAYASLLFVLLVFKKEFINRFFLYLSLSAFMVVTIGYVQYFLYPNLRNLYYLGWDEHLYRIFSSFLDPNFVGGFFVLEIILLTYLFIKSKLNNFLLVPILFTIIALFLTYSRSSYIAFLVSTVIFFIFFGRKKLIGIVAAVFLIGLVFLPKNLGGEGVNLLRTASIEARVDSYSDAIKVFESAPVFGVGFNAYRYAQIDLGLDNTKTLETSHSGAGVSNSFLFVLATTGLAGLAAYLYFWYRMVEGILRFPKLERAMGMAVLIGMFTHSMFENTLFYIFITTFIFLLIGGITRVTFSRSENARFRSASWRRVVPNSRTLR